MIKPLTIAALVFGLSGCATLNQSECENADWHLIGYQDGARGKALSYLNEHRKACAEYGIRPQRQEYQKGREAGLLEFCVVSKGFEAGRSGYSLSRVCPQPQAADFERGWHQGRELYRAQQRLDDSERQLQRQREHISDLETRIGKAEAELISDATNHKRRKVLLVEIKALNTELALAEQELLDYEDEVAVGQLRVREIEARYDY